MTLAKKTTKGMKRPQRTKQEPSKKFSEDVIKFYADLGLKNWPCKETGRSLFPYEPVEINYSSVSIMID